MNGSNSLLDSKNGLLHKIFGFFDYVARGTINDNSNHIIRNTRFINSLRSRGYAFNITVFALLIVIIFFFFGQREKSLDQLAQYQQIQQTQDTLLKADLVAFHVVTVLFSDVTESEIKQVVAYFSTLKQHYQRLAKMFPEEVTSFQNLEQSIPQTPDEPAELYLQKVQVHLARSKNELDRLILANQNRMTSLVKDYRQQNDMLILKTLILGSIGLAFIGTIITLFFNQLKSDILNLLQRTTEIVNGYRGEPLPVNRQDELGQLTNGINFMSQALADREQDLEMERRKSSFHEKMIAIDSLAGGLAHELGNSAACISGLADEIARDKNNGMSAESFNNLALLQNYTGNLVELNQSLSLISTQHLDKDDWIDINQHLTSIINLIRLDQRWQAVEIKLEADRQLPAIFFSSSRFDQLIAHLFENALEALSNQNKPEVIIQTIKQDDQWISIVFQDNGSGVTDDDLRHIFEPFFTTKPQGQGTGLGLAICWAIIDSLNGDIQAESLQGKGLRLTMRLPVNHSPAIDAVENTHE